MAVYGYYALILLSVAMFGACFAVQDVYRSRRGAGLFISLEFSLVSSLASGLVLYAVNAFQGVFWEFTPFTLLMAALASINGFAFTFCSFTALGKINLSLYSLFSMLGGMVLPYLQGLFFYGEQPTVANSVCFALVLVALLLTVEWRSIGRGKKGSGVIYYIGVFTLNGMSGVLSKLFTSLPYEKTSATGYSLLASCVTVVIAAILLLTLGRRLGATRTNLFSLGIAATSGVVNRTANLFLLIAISAGVPNTVQYPMVTGGVMIVSTLIALFGSRKPSRRELISVGIAFLATLSLFVIPI